MQLLQEGFQPGVHQEGVQELGKLWDELFFVVWVDICKRILKKCSEGRKKAKDTLEQLQEEQGRAEGVRQRIWGSLPCQGAAAAQICGHTGTATGQCCA